MNVTVDVKQRSPLLQLLITLWVARKINKFLHFICIPVVNWRVRKRLPLHPIRIHLNIRVFPIFKACILRTQLNIILHLCTISHAKLFFNIFMQTCVIHLIYPVHIVSIIMSARTDIQKHYAGITKIVLFLGRNKFFTWAYIRALYHILYSNTHYNSSKKV
jgi:hypothetical protein